MAIWERKHKRTIEPLHPKLQTCINDVKYYELMALTDAIRIGKAREQNIAFEMLKENLICLKTKP